MSTKEDIDKLDGLIRKYLNLKTDIPLKDTTTLASLGAPEFRIIDLGIAVETEFAIKMSADKALRLTTIGAWRKLVR